MLVSDWPVPHRVNGPDHGGVLVPELLEDPVADRNRLSSIDRPTSLRDPGSTETPGESLPPSQPTRPDALRGPPAPRL
jgi:hypothetical protein